MKTFDVDLESCRKRQSRLVETLQRESLDGALITQNVHVQWLTGVYFPPVFSSSVFLSADGELTLISPHKKPPIAAADNLERFDAKLHSTMRNDQSLACLETLARVVGKLGGQIGVEFSSFGPHAQSLVSGRVTDIEPLMYQLRRQKEKDELAKIQHAIDATEFMYKRARQIIQPGISEIEVFNELQTVAVDFFGEPLTGTGNDYQTASRGGPPRRGKTTQAGELYILDLGPAFRGYFADNARTLAVSGPTEDQTVASQWIAKALAHVEQSVRPGKSCRDLFNEVQQLLDQSPVGTFNHHLGHGIGLFPHEGPHLNPNWDDTFAAGDVSTAEPGLYDPQRLNAGIRIENDYVVTIDGVRNLSTFETSL